jgi:N-methylhydantoinase A
MLCAPVAFDMARSLTVALDDAPWGEIAVILDAMVRDCRSRVAKAGVPEREIVTTRSADMRYRGQGHEVQFDLEGLDWPHVDVAEVLRRFRAEYERLNAVRGPDAPVEFITWRASARGPVPQLPLHKGFSGEAKAKRSTRHVYFRETSGFVDTRVVPAGSLAVGETLAGPALIELGDATITVGPGATAQLREDGLVLITLPT